MTFRTLVKKINFDKLIGIIVTIIIIVYIIIKIIQNFDFSDVKDTISKYQKEISMLVIYEYLDNHPDYFYKIDGSVYCISKEDLIDSNEVDNNFIDNMQGNIIEATYQDDGFVFKYNDECIER